MTAPECCLNGGLRNLAIIIRVGFFEDSRGDEKGLIRC